MPCLPACPGPLTSLAPSHASVFPSSPQCVTCGCCGIENCLLIVDVVFHAAGATLWGIAGTVFAK